MNMAHTILFSPSGDSFVTCAWSGLERWPVVPVADGELAIGPPQPFTPALTSPRLFVRASLAGDDVFTTIHRGPIQGYRSGTNFISLAGSERTTSIATSSDGKWIAAGYWGSSGVRLWDAQTGKFVREFPTFQRALMAFTPDSRWLAIGAVDEYCFWNVATSERGMRIPRAQAGAMWGPLAFSRDGQLMALASSRWLVQLREVSTGNELASLEYPDTATISWLAFSPSGTQLAVATDGVYLWDLRRLRQELAALNLDWDQPPFSLPNATSSANPGRVKILSASHKAKP
jgi:WD40 repeat protein